MLLATRLRKSIFLGNRTLRTLVEISNGKERKFLGLKKPAPRSDRSSFVRSLLLPVGFPFSVHKCYLETHIYQFIESTAGSVISTLCASALLESVGVASSTMTTASANVAIQWILKDGFGEIGKLVFIQQASYLFDSYPKTAKLAGEIISISGHFVSISTLLFPHLFLPLASLAFMLRGIHYSIWAVTHSTFAKMNGSNIGDLIAKDDSQVSLAHLLGMGIGVSLLSIDTSFTFIFSIFSVMAALQILMTVKFIQAAKYECLNLSRIQLLARAYLVDKKSVPPPESLKEHWLGEFVSSKSDEGNRMAKIVFPSSLEKVLYGQDLAKVNADLELLAKEKYLITKLGDQYSIILMENASERDCLKAIFHSCVAHEMADGSVDIHSHLVNVVQSVQSAFPHFEQEILHAGWRTDLVYWADTGVRFRSIW